MALSSTWTTGTGNPKIVSPATGTPTLTIDLSTYKVERKPENKTENIIQKRESADYSRNDLLVGRSFQYEFLVVDVSSTDISTWFVLNGQSVKFYPHVEKTSDHIECLCFLEPAKYKNMWTDAIRFILIGKDVI